MCTHARVRAPASFYFCVCVYDTSCLCRSVHKTASVRYWYLKKKKKNVYTQRSPTVRRNFLFRCRIYFTDEKTPHTHTPGLNIFHKRTNRTEPNPVKSRSSNEKISHIHPMWRNFFFFFFPEDFLSEFNNINGLKNNVKYNWKYKIRRIIIIIYTEPINIHVRGLNTWCI